MRATGPLRGAVVAGAIAGFISAGVGSRVVMRIIALMNDDRTGAKTDASAIVGDISFGGTMSLLVLGTIAGVLGGLLYLGLRRWLWVPAGWRGVAFGVVTLMTVGVPLFDTANVDFQIFEPVLAVIGMFAALFLLNGVLLAPLLERIHPQPPYSDGVVAPRAAAGIILVVTLLGAAVMAGTVASMIEDEGTCYTAVGGGEGCAVFKPDGES